MRKIGRRAFVASALATSVATFALRRTAKAADSQIEIVLDEPVGSISPHLYSHFVEHLGGGVYDGIWVGDKSKTPACTGRRKALVDRLKALKPGLIRYPGGCF